MNTSKFKSYVYRDSRVYPVFNIYAEGRGLRIDFHDLLTGESHFTATVNTSEKPNFDQPLQVVIKNCSENTGVLKWLIDNELVKEVRPYLGSTSEPFVFVHLTPKLLVPMLHLNFDFENCSTFKGIFMEEDS